MIMTAKNEISVVMSMLYRKMTNPARTRFGTFGEAISRFTCASDSSPPIARIECPNATMMPTAPMVFAHPVPASHPSDSSVRCTWNGGSGAPRIRLFASGPIRVSFTPFGTCASAMHPPAIVSITGVAQEGYIDFLDFGNVIQNDRPSDARDPISNDFKIEFGQRLSATFNFTMGDDRVLTAEKLGVDPAPAPTIGGMMMGNFDFDLTRGQGAQTFP